MLGPLLVDGHTGCWQPQGDLFRDLLCVTFPCCSSGVTSSGGIGGSCPIHNHSLVSPRTALRRSENLGQDSSLPGLLWHAHVALRTEPIQEGIRENHHRKKSGGRKHGCQRIQTSAHPHLEPKWLCSNTPVRGMSAVMVNPLATSFTRFLSRCPKLASISLEMSVLFVWGMRTLGSACEVPARYP